MYPLDGILHISCYILHAHTIKVFEKYKECESAFRADLGDDVPDFLDWQSVK